MENLVVNPEAFDVRDELNTEFKDEIRLIVPFNIENNRKLFKLMKELKGEKLGDKVIDYYFKNYSKLRLRKKKLDNGGIIYQKISGFKSDKEVEYITKEEFLECSRYMEFNTIRKEVLAVVNIDKFKACEELIIVENRVYFSLEIETEDIINAFVGLMELLNKYDLKGDIITSPIVKYFYNGL